MSSYSLVKQLQKTLSLWLVLGFFILLILGLLGGAWIAKTWLEKELELDTQQLLERVVLQDEKLELNPENLRVNFIEPASGFYYMLHAQRIARILSPSLTETSIELPQSVGTDAKLFLTSGPNDQILLVRFAEYEIQDRWLDIAVARDISYLFQVLVIFALGYSIGLFLVTFVFILGARALIQRRFNALPSVKQLHRLSRVQADLFNNRWPREWEHLVDRLHQALIQLRAHQVMQNHPRFSYRVLLPESLEFLIDKYKQQFPNKHLKINFRIEPTNILINQLDFDLIMSKLLDNAFQWCKEEVWVDIKHSEHKLCIRIQDDGNGMDPERLRQIQMRTQQKQAADDSSGLAQVEQMVYAYQGHLSYEASRQLGGLSVQLCFDRPNLSLKDN